MSPHYPEFGANQYHTDTHGHGLYRAEGSGSLYNQAAIVVGAYGRVELDHGAAP